MSQKELATAIRVEDELGNERAMSPQYLNDIEHDRRSPSSTVLVEQFGKILGLDRDYLLFLADRWPESLRQSITNEEQFSQVMQAFRRSVPR